MESGRLNLFEHDFNSPLDMLPANFDFAVSSLALPVEFSIAVVGTPSRRDSSPAESSSSASLEWRLAALSVFRKRTPPLPRLGAADHRRVEKGDGCFETSR
jgi:hypothetical protein